MSQVTVGVSLKMYFGLGQALEWVSAVAQTVGAHPAVVDGRVRVFLIPGFLAVPGAVDAVSGTPILIGAQDLAAEDRGAYTGEVGGPELAEAGARVVEVGHAERRRLFGEDEAVVAAKTAAALRNGLAPVLCIGEEDAGDPAPAATVIAQLDSALAAAPAGPVIAAYEPVWAIGAAQPAAPEHILAVCAALRERLDADPGRAGSVVIYGGSAGPGLLTALGDGVDGLFLGRFAHDPAALQRVVDEAAALADARRAAAAAR